MKKAIFLFLGFLLISFLSFAQNTPYLKPGNWKGVIYRLDGNSVPFSFNIALVKDKTIITLINAEELIIVDDFKKQSSDSLLITLPYFNASFEVATYNADQLEGYYIKTLNGKQIKASFIANWNQPRFIDYKPSKYDASGSMAGILNIVFKKNKQSGYNGMVNAGLSYPFRINGGLNLNANIKKSDKSIELFIE